MLAVSKICEMDSDLYQPAFSMNRSNPLTTLELDIELERYCISRSDPVSCYGPPGQRARFQCSAIQFR